MPRCFKGNLKCPECELYFQQCHDVSRGIVNALNVKFVFNNATAFSGRLLKCHELVLVITDLREVDEEELIVCVAEHAGKSGLL